MAAYHFTTVRLDGSRHYEKLRAMEFRDDEEAASFAKRIIRDSMVGAPAAYSGWIVYVTKGQRVVRSIPFTDKSLTK